MFCFKGNIFRMLFIISYWGFFLLQDVIVELLLIYIKKYFDVKGFIIEGYFRIVFQLEEFEKEVSYL